jgi:NADPH:quinone reductase-like Zn-dependent oxidoreductase
MTGYSIERSRETLTTWRSVPLDLLPEEGEIVARLDLAALTSNNVTYAVHGGPPLFYWNFFPATDPSWGVVPVWGYGTVVASRAPHVAEGNRLYGYWPSATHLRLKPGSAKAGGFADTASHRQGLAAVYNSYRPADDVTDPEAQALNALFQPLYGTGFVLAHTLAADVAAGRTVLLTSASSKTALATAFNLKAAGGRAVGLTSAANRVFVEQTGFYDRVLAYDEVETLDAALPTVLADFAGNGALKSRIHAHLTRLSASHIIGDTAWNTPGTAELAGPQPTLFFAPSAWEARTREIGPAAFDAELGRSLAAFLDTTPHWLRVERTTGADGYAEAFGRLLANGAGPDTGIVWKP